MSKKNSNVILKNFFKNLDASSNIYFDFKTKLNKSRNKSFVIAANAKLSGPPEIPTKKIFFLLFSSFFFYF